jgi:hypothetical protein
VAAQNERFPASILENAARGGNRFQENSTRLLTEAPRIAEEPNFHNSSGH